jgi:dipeptidyl aminopeptidase/acylaminoacyl peptidase
VWAPASDRVAFTSRVYPRCRSEACNASVADSIEQSPVKAHVADRLMYRHWNAWDDATRSHLFVANIADIAVRDLVPGAEYDVPPGPFGGSEGYAWSPDGRELAYSAKLPARDEAWSTDVNLYTVPATGGTSRVVTSDSRGADQNPVYSPDGRWIAYVSQARAGFEADKLRLMLMDRATGASRELLPGWDRSADSHQFTDAGKSLLIVANDRGRDRVLTVALDANGAARSAAPTVLVGDMNNVGPTLSRDGRTMVWLRDAADRPAELWVRSVQARGQTVLRALTHHNDALVSQLALAPAEDLWFRGANGDSVHAYLVRPPNQEPGRRYPLILLVHGGPQGAWLDQWHGRWNYAMFAATGAAVLAVNPRGSTGYGQTFTDDVSKDWGGKAYEDLMKGVDAALVAHPWLDGSRLGAAGGSYGGYMVNWIGGHSDRFRALVSHAGVFNLENMYGATEETWFPEWEYGGPYWEPKAMAEQYRKWSPHLAAGSMRTPTLVLHGELDYRVPYYEGVSLFTALQRQHVPSRLVVFPDEGHWVGKPQNQRLWWGEVQGWLTKYLNDPKPSTE